MRAPSPSAAAATPTATAEAAAEPASLRLKVDACDDVPTDVAADELGEPLVFNAETPLPQIDDEAPTGTICSYISADLQDARLTVSFTEPYDAAEATLESARGAYQRTEDVDSDVLGDEAYVGHHEPDTTVNARAGDRTFSVSSPSASAEQLVKIAESLVEPD